MSHYTIVKTRITNKQALIKALQRMGFKSSMIEDSTTLLPLKGYRGDNRSQHAHLRIKGSGWGVSSNYVGGASNDIGFEKQSDGSYVLHVSEYDSRKYNKDWQNQLTQFYAAEVIKEIAEQSCFAMTEEEINEKGELILTVENPF